MNDVSLIIVLLLISMQLLVVLPRYFVKKNGKEASQKAFDQYLKELVAQDKAMASHITQLTQNLNIVNYWLKTGYDPTAELTEEEKKQKDYDARRYARGEMTQTEAQNYRENMNKSRANFDIIDINQEEKSRRLNAFTVENMEPCDVDIVEMDFVYEGDFGEHIYYCVTPDALKKKYYRNVIYFTTAKPMNIPVNYPFKYDGAQMLSLYRHPAHAVWFLKNWKAIRDAMETEEAEEIPEHLEDVMLDFDL